MSKTVCIVCTGNTCRSPMAEGLLRKLLREAGAEGVKVFSAGTRAAEGLNAAYESQQAMRGYGVSLRGHRSAQLTREAIMRADVILTMEARHIAEVLALDRTAAGKTHTLKGFAAGVRGIPGADCDVRDPYSLPLDAYLACAKETLEHLKRALPLLLKELGIPKKPEK